MILSAAGTAGHGIAHAAEGLTLQQAVRTGLKTNPEFASRSHTQLATEERHTQAKALYLPSLDLSAETGYEATETPTIPGEDMNRRRVSLTLTQLLFDGFGTTSAIRRQRAQAEAAWHRTFEAAEFVGLNVASSFLNILRRRELLDAAQANIEDHRKILSRIKDGVKSGKFNKGDLAQVESRLERAVANAESIRQSLTEAMSAYTSVVGEVPPDNLTLPVFDKSLLPADIGEFLEQAKNSSPALAIAQAELDAAQAEHHASKSAYYPEVSLQLSSSRGEDLGGVSGSDNGDAALVVMQWNLFRGGSDRARVKETLHQKFSAYYDEMNAGRVLEQSVRDTWAARESTEKQEKSFRKQVTANEKVVEAYEDQFRVNRRSLIDLLDAENALFVAQSNAINADYSALFANYRLLALGGRLLDALGIVPAPDTPVETAEADDTAEGKKASPLKKLLQPPASFIDQRYIELGAYRGDISPEQAWRELMKGNADIMNGLPDDVQYIKSPGKDGAYRLHVGPVMAGAGEAVCKKMNARKAGGCIIVAN